MGGEYKLWNVSLIYETPGDRPANLDYQRYIVISESPKEAREKAMKVLLKTSAAESLNLTEDDIRCNVREVRTRQVNIPIASLPEDRNKFTVSARLSEDGQSLEFIVKEK